MYANSMQKICKNDAKSIQNLCKKDTVMHCTIIWHLALGTWHLALGTWEERIDRTKKGRLAAKKSSARD